MDSRYRRAVLHKELVGPRSDQLLGGMKHARARSVEDDNEAATTVTSRVTGRSQAAMPAMCTPAGAQDPAYVLQQKLLKFDA